MVEELLKFYRENARDLPWRRNPTPYRVWISEIMLQQTRVEAVKDSYVRFLREFPDVRTLADSSEEKLFKLWEGLGYYSRARNLRRAAGIIASAGAFPDTPEAIAALPGIGPYTTGAIASIAFDLPVPAVDGNVLRVLSRHDGKNHTRESAAARLLPLFPPVRRGEFTQALMELGATVCLPNGKPLCEACPWRSECAALRENRIGELPEKTEKKPRRIEVRTVVLLECGGSFALEKRPARGLLAGLWAFPNFEGESDPEEKLRSLGFRLESCERLRDSKHIFTHIEWRMRNFRAAALSPLPENSWTWKTPREIADECAVPSAFSYLSGLL